MFARSLTALLFLFFAAAVQANDYQVSGVASPYDYYNGTYVEAGTHFGKPYYRKDTPEIFTGELFIFYDFGRWGIGPETMMSEIYNYSSADTPPETGWYSFFGPSDDIRVRIAGPSISYSSKLFIESLENDGSFNQRIEITHNNFDGEHFSGSEGDEFVASGLVTVSNLPAGLTAKVVYQSSTLLTFILEGQANIATQADNVSNVTLSFSDAAFVGSASTSAENTSGSLVSDVVVQFRDELTVGTSGDYETIESAISAAAAYDIIRVDEGIYTEPNLVISRNLALVGAGAGKTVVQAAADPGVAGARVINVSYGLTDVLISDLTIRHGYLSGGNQQGAGIRAESNFTLRNCHVTQNRIVATADSYGAGLFASAGIRMENCLVDSNELNLSRWRYSGGAGLYFVNDSSIINSTFYDNSITSNSTNSDAMRGAAILGESFSDAQIINSTIYGNHSVGLGGGIALSSNGVVEILNSIVYGNTASRDEDLADVYIASSSGNTYVRHSITQSVSPSAERIDSLDTDPLLNSFDNYGGDTSGFQLLAGSPAIGAGLVTDRVPDLDQRGYSRSGDPDIGALQYDGTLPYDVTYHANGGVGRVPELGHSLSDGKSFTVSEASSLTFGELNFTTWNTQPDGSGTDYAPNDVVTIMGGDVDLYAQWEPAVVRYTLTYLAGLGGSIDGDASQLVDEGSDGTEITAVADTGYSFVDWSDGVTTASRQELNVAADVSVTANFARNEYTVTFIAGGAQFAQESVLHGDAVTDPGVPIVTGYTFIDWDTDFSAVTSDLTVTANLVINSYVVNFFDHLENLIATTSVNHGSAASAPSAPSRDGYTFSGWSADISSVTSSLDVTAQYTINSYTVTFVDYDSSPLGSDTVEYLQGATAPADPTRTGYTFTGWDVDFGSVSENMTVTAQYTINSYTVNFVDYDSSPLGSDTVEYLTAATAPADPTRTGYTFSGWDVGFGSVSENMTVTAQYSINSYTVSFVDYDSSPLGSDTVEYLTAATAPADPTRTGYTFSGWDVAFDSVTDNMTVTAQYSINSYTVSFVDYDNSPLGSDTVEYLTAATAPADPTRTGYTFTGWSVAFASVIENMTVTAQYTINSYTVSFVDYDNSPLGSDTVEYLTAATAPADPSRTGYTFSGWDVAFDSVTADITVTAQYSINSYTVTFNDFDGSLLGTDTVDYLTAATAPADPTRTGYTFSGWDVAFDSVTADITVTAQYSINSYTVSFVDYDNSPLGSDTVEYLTAATAPADPSRTGYTFSGWDVAFDSVTADITVTAQYSINSYTVTFNDFDGSLLGTDTVDYLTAATAPADPTRTGYTFAGWDVGFDSVTDNMTVTAQYSINSYTVTFNDFDGTLLGSDTVEYLTAATAPADPTRTGYTFAGWDIAFDSVTADITVTAQYTINSYTVSFVDYDNSPLGSDTVEYLQGATAPADPTRTGYTFSGWDVAFDSVTDNMTVTAQYSITSYTVSFVDYDNSPLGSDTVEYLTAATAPADPTRTGYTFSGWDVAFDSVTENITVTAQYTINSYTVTFNDFDGTFIDSDTVEYLTAATAPADPTRTGYTFTGWDADFTSVTEDMTVTAQYTINSYTVTFVDYDSSPLGSDTVEYLTAATTPADPTRTGYTFSGWDAVFDSVTENMTVTAQYTINSYTVTFNDFDGTFIDSDTVEYLQGATAPADPTRTGYTFSGWDVAFDSVTADITVTAQYTINSYTVTFNDFDGTLLGSDTVEYLTAATAPADPTRTGYTFAGWDVGFDSVTDNMTVTAQYTINSYTVSFVDYDNSPLGSDTVEYLQGATAPADPTRTGYTFSGWDVAFDSVTDNMTVTAQYSINSYTVSFVDYDNSPLGSNTVEYLTAATAPADPTRTGYTFAGWDVGFDSVTDNMTVTAQYTINSYTVSFVDYDNSPLGSDTVEYLTAATAPADPTRTGYTFSGWDAVFDSVTENMTITAQYSINSYTVSFVDYDNSPLGSDTVEYLTTATAPADPTRTGYTFAGWDVGFDSVTADITVAAQYTINSYTVSFVDYDNSPLGSDTVEYLQGATAPADPTRTGYTFAGWDVGFDSVTDNMTVTAQYTINSYTVSFVDYDNSPLGSDTVEYLQGATAPADPTRTGYTFAGWDVGFDSVTDNMTVTAQYTINSYTVSFVDYDNSPLGSDTVEYLTAATAPADPTRTGYTFAGWDVGFDSVTDNMTVTAQYTINSYTVTFNDFDGSLLGTDTVDYLTAATAPADPTRTGYTFAGWDVAFDSVTDNMTVTAQYTINSYTVSFVDYDNSPLGSDTVEYLTAATAPADPTRTGYTFAGWDVGFDSVTDNMTVTAQYTINSYTVSFVDYDNSPLGSDTVEYLQGATAPADPTRTGYTFSGWDVAFDSVTDNMTVTAQYSINSYTVSFVDYDNSPLSSDTVEYLTAATAPADPTRTGYTFSGWDVAFDSVTADITVTAQYSINSYTVSFVDYDNSPLGSDTVEYLASATAPADPTRTGYTFSGWDVGFGSVSENMTVTAQYSINSYTVSFVDYDSSPLGSDTVEYLQGATAPADPTRTGHTFSGWDVDFGSVSENMTVTAQYTINSYTVNFVDYDSSPLGSDTVEYLTAATAPADPTRTGYTFSGWDAVFDSVTENMTITAQYSINSYTVSFVDYDNSPLGSDTVEYLASATAPADPTRTGYTFSGWDAVFDSVTADITVTAQYSINSYTVTFNDFDGSLLGTDTVDYLTAA
ncbi:InlB B-repeat-containing protein, partial [Aliidiomarina quisquiliarum]|uniref:InlB B-repeat-containing protein n=1 Tax=Aliidiomarina quisquiliarum TaxID=2938947 RepID=UPI00237D0A96